ncbi:MAG: HD domain-containing phosphohydrolase [Spirulinaceae cyanobacterium]
MSVLDSQPAKILVVDDHASSRMAVSALLSVEGYEVIELESSKKVLECVIAQKPDLILLDVMLPDLDGFEICKGIKANETTASIPVIFITVLNDRKTYIKSLKAGGDDLLPKPLDRLELSTRVKSFIRQKRLYEDLDHTEQVLFSIAKAIGERDSDRSESSERLIQLAQSFGEYLGLPLAEVKDLIKAIYLHDLGTVGIPDAVLLKEGTLTLEERKLINQHVLIGEKLCQPLRDVEGVLPIIRHHHERWDGGGYPDGLVGEEIPLLAQIFQIIDIYNALTSKRPYKQAFTPQQALEIILEEKDKGWRNPQLVAQFTEFVRSIWIEERE